MKAKIMCIGLLLASCATNAGPFGVFDLGEVYEQSDRANAMRQEREYREMQMQQQRRQQQREEQQFQEQRQRAEQERQQAQEQRAQQQQQQIRQQQSRPTGKACMDDCRKAGYKYNECRDECMPQQVRGK